MSKNLYIFRGLPGSGKTTLARKWAALVVEPDMFRYDPEMHYIFDSDRNDEVNLKTIDLAKYAVGKLGINSIAVAATHVKVDFMRPLIELGKHYGYTVSVVECYGNYGNVHNVPESVVNKMAREFEFMDDKTANDLGVSIIRVYGPEDENRGDE